MHVDFVGEPWVNGSPEGRPTFLIEPLLNDTKPFPVLCIKGASPVHRVIASVGHAVISRPLLGRLGIVSHKR